MKKRILIISYHFPPLAVVASQRAWAFAQKLIEQGYDVEVLTHDFSDDSKFLTEGQFYGSQEASFKIYRVPLDRHRSIWARIPLLRKAHVLTRWVQGHFDLGGAGKFSYRTMKTFLEKHLLKEKYDLLIGIYSPHSHLRLCYEMNRGFDIPYVLDFRDLWSINANKPNYAPSGKEAIRTKWIKHYWSKWTRNALFLTTISGPMSNFLAASFHKRVLTITNGFHPEETVRAKNSNGRPFEILYTGRLYDEQDLSPFLEGCSLWLKKTGADEVRLSFIGLDKIAQERVRALCESHELVDFLHLYDKQPRGEILKRQAKASILYYPGWPNRPGVYSSKLFEYLATGAPILQAPNDHNVIEDLLTRSNSGLSSNDPKVIAEFLEREWQTLGLTNDDVQLHASMNATIQFHTWGNQVSVLAEAIERALK